MQMQSTKRKRYQKDYAPADDIVTLIQLVRQNPALYNYKLQPNQRRRVDILNGWAHIAEQIGNKYTVEECRRKWKNLRDTYHQYRLRKPKVENGLSKWRYAKDLEFLSNVYQPKLKSHRQQHYAGCTDTKHLLQSVKSPMSPSSHDELVAHANILVNDGTETFILTTYEESVNDDVVMDHDHSTVSNIELSNEDDIEGVVEIVKHEHVGQPDEDDAAGLDAEYEEVCMFEEAGNVASDDCETIMGATRIRNATADDVKEFTYMDAHEFCMDPTISSGVQLSTGNVLTAENVKSTAVITNAADAALDVSLTDSNNTNATLSSPLVQLQSTGCDHPREELDLFFDFLKKKVSQFSKEEITQIQVEFLNCVLRREAENSNANKALMGP